MFYVLQMHVLQNYLHLTTIFLNKLGIVPIEQFRSHELILDQLSIYDQFQMITYTGMQDDICCHLCLEV